MATHTFYLSWQLDYDYSDSRALTGEREKLLKILEKNGITGVRFADLWNSEDYLHDGNGKRIEAKSVKQ